ncbi:MAG: TetR/AcrR family transcriptional regulator [Anaerolineaceae bacterium]|nr:TetR/AcrR family transcriptional regulator [Anaerolineaceae bacterium]
MSKIRREEQHAAIRAEIKGAARRLMEKEGTAGISIRAIGREMDMTAPALYHYYPSRDALITDLILDAFGALADQLGKTRQDCYKLTAVKQLRHVLLAYRGWALACPIDFQLIYGNPIPGYQAPEERTVPAATRSFIVIASLIAQVMETPDFSPQPEYSRVPPELVPHFERLSRQLHEMGVDLPQMALYTTTVGWPLIHGIIMLELFHHLQPVVGDVDALYRSEIENLLRRMGMLEKS